MQGADAVLHDFELVLDAGADVGVAGVEDVVQFRCVMLVEELQALGGGEFVADVFEQDLDAALAGEDAEFVERRERRLRQRVRRIPGR
jgi:hypothetical protein